jgi:hypothetical protein
VINGSGAFKQTLVEPEIEAVGRGLTLMVTDPEGDPAQTVLLISITPVRLYTNAPTTPVGTASVTVLVPAVVEIVCAAPPFMLYVKVKGAVPSAPENVMRGGVASLHTSTLPEI